MVKSKKNINKTIKIKNKGMDFERHKKRDFTDLMLNQKPKNKKED